MIPSPPTFLPRLVEVDDLKKITNSLTVLCSEKQKQEKVGLDHARFLADESVLPLPLPHCVLHVAFQFNMLAFSYSFFICCTKRLIFFLLDLKVH